MKNLTFFVPSHTDFYKCMEIKEKVVISSDLSNLAGAADCKSLGRFIRRFAWTAFGVVRWRSPNQLFRWAEPNTPLANKKPPKRAAFYWLGSSCNTRTKLPPSSTSQKNWRNLFLCCNNRRLPYSF